MSVRERIDDDRNRQAGDPADNGPADVNLGRARLAGQGLLAAGADAIQKALSGDSESFLAATRQQGGQ
ncbi:MAG TPA: hypothetical protein VLM38_06740 [Blastocatellia bacterium]|nr:hypothetical protein [Blastocatellia bacterium]